MGKAQYKSTTVPTVGHSIINSRTCKLELLLCKEKNTKTNSCMFLMEPHKDITLYMVWSGIGFTGNSTATSAF